MTRRWIKGGALTTLLALRGLKEGDEVLIDTDAWFAKQGWARGGTHVRFPTARGRVRSAHSNLVATLEIDQLGGGSGRANVWFSAGPHIIAVRVKEKP